MTTKPETLTTCARCGHTQPGGQTYCANCGLPTCTRPKGFHPRTWWPWSRWFLLHKVLHVDDTPHRIALGLALGMFTAFTPTVGLQMLLTIALCWLFRANKLVGLPLAWITNPITIPPVFYLNYRIGRLILGGPPMTIDDFRVPHGNWGQTIHQWFSVVGKAFLQCWVGSLIIGAVLGTITYFAGYQLIVWYRAHHRRRFPGGRIGQA